jgi:hypothetical protein
MKMMACSLIQPDYRDQAARACEAALQILQVVK